jgi:hypothetical protein
MKLFPKISISFLAIACIGALVSSSLTSCSSEELHRGGIGAAGGAIVGGLLGGGNAAAAGAIIGGLGGAATARDRYTDYAYPRGPVGRPYYPARPPSGYYGYY